MNNVEGGGAENTGLEKSGLENVGPNRRGGKDGKTRDQISMGGKGGTGKRGNIMCMGSEMRRQLHAEIHPEARRVNYS